MYAISAAAGSDVTGNTIAAILGVFGATLVAGGCLCYFCRRQANQKKDAQMSMHKKHISFSAVSTKDVDNIKPDNAVPVNPSDAKHDEVPINPSDASSV